MKPPVESAHDIRPDLRPENPLDARLVALYQSASPEKKLATVHRLNCALQELKAVQLAASHPEWTAIERQAELRRWWLSSDNL
jgi:hypothetical protein